MRVRTKILMAPGIYQIQSIINGKKYIGSSKKGHIVSDETRRKISETKRRKLVA